MAVDLNALLETIMECDERLKAAQEIENAAIRERGLARAALEAAQKAFDETVAAARAWKLPVESAAETPELEPAEPDANDPNNRKIPVGGLPATSPALKYDYLPGVVNEADDAREDNVEII